MRLVPFREFLCPSLFVAHQTDGLYSQVAFFDASRREWNAMVSV